MQRVWRFAGLAAVLMASSCSFSYGVEFNVTVADDIVLEQGSQISYVLHEGEREGGIVGARASMSETITDLDDRDYTHDDSVCCAPDPTVELYAFIDLNGNMEFDEGEPWGEDPNHPITLRDTGDTYVATITIENQSPE